MSVKIKIFLGIMFIFIWIVSYFSNKFFLQRNNFMQDLYIFDRLLITPYQYYNDYEFFVLWSWYDYPEKEDFYNWILDSKKKLLIQLKSWENLSFWTDSNWYFDKNILFTWFNAFNNYKEFQNKVENVCVLWKVNDIYCKNIFIN